MRRSPNWTQKPSGLVALDRSHPIADKLIAYWPLTDGAGRRPAEIVTMNGPSVATNLNLYPLAWSPAANAGMAARITNSATNAGLTYKSAAHGTVSDMTVGLLAQIPAGTVICRPLLISGGLNFRFCADASDVNSHWRVDFITNTSYFRINLAQMTAGEWRTMFATRRPGSSPVPTFGLWPDGRLTNPTIFDFGTASGTVLASDLLPFNWNNGGASLASLNIVWLAVWARVLRSEEMEELHRHPWCMLQDYGYRFTQQAPAAAGAWASRVRHGGQPGSRVIV
jgi:hypothetical protein